MKKVRLPCDNTQIDSSVAELFSGKTITWYQTVICLTCLAPTCSIWKSEGNRRFAEFSYYNPDRSLVLFRKVIRSDFWYLMMDESADRVTTHEHLTSNGHEHASNFSLQIDTICAQYITPKVWHLFNVTWVTYGFVTEVSGWNPCSETDKQSRERFCMSLTSCCRQIHQYPEVTIVSSVPFILPLIYIYIYIYACPFSHS